MRQALIDARLPPSAIDHVNCHATSTPLGDQAELTALLQLLSNSPLGALYAQMDTLTVDTENLIP